MPFSTDELTQLETLLADSDGGLQVVAEFRSRFPGRTLTRCDESDMGVDEPYKRFANVDLHLVDAHDHCWQLTRDPAQATGVVVAKRRRRA